MNTPKGVPSGLEKISQAMNRAQAAAKHQQTTERQSSALVEKFAGIKVVGIGGAGCSAVNRMMSEGMGGVDYISINTDPQALFLCNNSSKKIAIGQSVTKGLGAGGNPEIGLKAIEESRAEVTAALQGADMIFITAGMGGGTGTGAAPVVAEIAKEIGALSIAVVTKPFSFEGDLRRVIAEKGITQLAEKVDALITIPNNNLLSIVEKKTTLIDAFKMADKVLKEGVQGITDIMTKPGLVNVDFADIKTIMQDSGSALMGIGESSGDKKAAAAAEAAITNRLQDANIDGAKGVLFSITGSPSMTLSEVDEAAKIISQAVDPNAKIIFGAVIDEKFQDRISVTVIATGFENREEALDDYAENDQTLGFSGFSSSGDYKSDSDDDIPDSLSRLYKKR